MIETKYVVYPIKKKKVKLHYLPLRFGRMKLQ